MILRLSARGLAMSPKYLASTELCFCVIALPVLSLNSILMNYLKLAN